MFSHRLLALTTALVAVTTACTPLATPAPTLVVPPTFTAPATTTAVPTAIASPTATDCPTAWSWAYGPGSTEFDATLSQSLSDSGLTVRLVTSSTFGENNLCNGSYHVKDLDVTVELAVADASDEERFSELTATVLEQVNQALPTSGAPNVGRVEVRFVAPEATWRCSTLDDSTECQAVP